MPRIQPLFYNPDEPMPPQTQDWTCAACSLAWLNRALAIDHATTEPEAVMDIGEPEHINSEWGLMDASGGRLVECLRAQGAPAFNAWLSWNQIYGVAMDIPLLIGGIQWNHWVGVRTANNGVLYLANSAPGWQGVYNTMEEQQWNALGPFAVVPVPLLHQLPPTPQAQPK
jgi:hypothetical protein